MPESYHKTSTELTTQDTIDPYLRTSTPRSRRTRARKAKRAQAHRCLASVHEEQGQGLP